MSLRALTRRSLGSVVVGLVAALTITAPALAQPAPPPTGGADPTITLENAQLDALHAAAKAEGGTLTVWAGGDAPNQADWIKNAFRKRFPDVPIEITVDLSKYHDVKIDKALADGGALPDVAHLQTTQDFENWKRQGALTEFKPVGFEHIWPQFKDHAGAYYPIALFGFSPTVNPSVTDIPTGYQDFLKPEYKDKLVLTPPADDDAVLYVYSKILDKYGDAYMRSLAAQNPTWIRGTAAPAILVSDPRYRGNLTGSLAKGTRALPATDPFIIWPQEAAIFARAAHPSAAKLYLSWITSKEFQSTIGTAWRVRSDLPAPKGLKQFYEYHNASPREFMAFMRDRKRVEALREKMTGFFGPVQGESPLTDPEVLKVTDPSAVPPQN